MLRGATFICCLALPCLALPCLALPCLALPYLALPSTGQCDSVEGNDVYSTLHCITSCKGFKLACINVNSLFKHIDEIRYILINSPLEVLAINESKLDDTISDTEVYIPGYVIIRKDRSRSGGGVALYIRENLSYTKQN